MSTVRYRILERVIQAIQRMGKDAGIHWTYTDDKAFPQPTAEGVPLLPWIGFKESLGKEYVIIGTKGKLITFPPKKHDDYSFERMATVLMEYVTAHKYKGASEEQRELNRPLSDEMRETLNLKDHLGDVMISPSSIEGKPILITIKLERAYEVDDAYAIVRSLAAMGIR
jgi:hypothetical protein